MNDPPDASQQGCPQHDSGLPDMLPLSVPRQSRGQETVTAPVKLGETDNVAEDESNLTTTSNNEPHLVGSEV